MGIHLMPPLFETVIPQPSPGSPYTFYPDGASGLTTVDGWIRKYQAGVKWVWADIISGDGNEVRVEISGQGIHIIPHSTTDWWLSLGRAYFMFDTSPLGTGKTIKKAHLLIWAGSKLDQLGISPSYNIYGANPISDNNLVVGDFSRIGSTPLSDAIAYGDIPEPGLMTFVLNASGRASIQKTGITGFCFRNANYDASGVSPTWSAFPSESNVGISFVEAVEEQRPRLVVWT